MFHASVGVGSGADDIAMRVGDHCADVRIGRGQAKPWRARSRARGETVRRWSDRAFRLGHFALYRRQKLLIAEAEKAQRIAEKSRLHLAFGGNAPASLSMRGLRAA